MAHSHRMPVPWLIALTLVVPLVTHPAAWADGSWRGRGPAQNGWGPSGIYDPVRERMVIFGGQPDLVVVGNSTNLVWELSLTGTPSWTALTTIGSAGPYGRQSHSAIYDAPRDRMIIFGGQGGNIYNDVWAFSLGTHAWTQIVPVPGPAPVARQGHSAIYDPLRDRMLVFGGSDVSNIDMNDVWALSLGASPAWTQITPSGTPPAVRSWHSSIYDPVRDRMVVFAGWQWTPAGSLDDTWALDLAGTPTWSVLAASGSPVARNSHSAIYDPVGDRMVVYGGWVADLTVLSFSGSPAWSVVTPSGASPSLRDGTAGIYDAPRQRMVTYGGVVEEFGSVWAVTLTGSPAWSPIAPVGGPTTAGVHTIYDSLRDRLVVRSFSGQIWARSLTGEPAWTQITTTGGPPPIANLPSVIHDPPRDRIVVHGGEYSDETWALSLATNAWTKIEPPGALPSARGGHSAIYDPIRDQMIVYGGGWGDWSDFHEEIWALPLGGGSWSQITPVGTEPIGRDGHTAIYDPVGDRMVICGGHDGFGTFRRDVWALDLDTQVWTQITPTTALPRDVVWMTSVYDATRERMLLFGGTDLVNGGASNELWSLTLSGTSTWTLLNPSGVKPMGRQNHGAIYDPLRDRLLAYGGLDVNFQFRDVWEYTPGGTTDVPDGLVAASGLTFAPPRPNPSGTQSVHAFTLARPGRVMLDVFDASGRRVRRLLDAEFPTGSHSAIWAGDDDQGRTVATGLYFVRLKCGKHQLTTRAVRMN